MMVVVVIIRTIIVMTAVQLQRRRQQGIAGWSGLEDTGIGVDENLLSILAGMQAISRQGWDCP